MRFSIQGYIVDTSDKTVEEKNRGVSNVVGLRLFPAYQGR